MMNAAVQKMWDFYGMTQNAPIHQREFGYYCLDRWVREGHLKGDDGMGDYQAYLNGLFGYDEKASFDLWGLGWCEGGLVPAFPEEVVEDRGEYEVVRDFAGRRLLCFKGRRNGFMPEYIAHPVTDRSSWERDVRWRMSPEGEGRFRALDAELSAAECAQREGFPIVQRCVGGYMYLRSLIGPMELPYMFYDDPALIHACMEAWFDLADAVAARHQARVSFDEFFIGEDICYNHGSLISPAMIREFLFPYYEQLLGNIRRRQRDGRALHFQVDTDGFCEPVIDLYRGIGMDIMSPFEVASGCDVVRTALNYPDLRITGGIDKRILAAGRDAIDRELERIMPVLRRRGGFIPTCDHGVPEEVSFENYMHYRARMREYCT